MNWRAYPYRADGYSKLEEDFKAYEDYSRVIALRPKIKEGYKNKRHYSSNLWTLPSCL